MEFLKLLYDNIGGLLIALIAVVLGYWAIRTNARLEEQKLAFEIKKFQAEEQEREKLSIYREQEYRRFSQPASDLAEHLTKQLVNDPSWAHRALESAKLLPYKDTLFGERTQHFREEKDELAERFSPHLIKRCEALIENGRRHVYLLIDAGTTLLPFFRIIGQETSRLCQNGEEWLEYLHLATNNIPGIEQLMLTGRRTQYGRYSKLAIEDCQLLPGLPLPIFASVAGEQTNEAIRNLRIKALDKGGEDQPVFISLVVGNWVRIRNTEPRCPVPMARGNEHLKVKETLIHNADEIFVISPLGKIFINQSNEDVNTALGFDPTSTDPEKSSYEEVVIDSDLAPRVKLISTIRQPHRILHRHSNRLEDAFEERFKIEIDEDLFAQSKIEELPNLLFTFNKLPNNHYGELETEFPHYHSRTKRKFLEMFSVDAQGSGQET